MNNAGSNLILNGKMVSGAEARIPVTSRGLLYGDGCFETFRGYAGRFFELQSHLERLAEGLNFLSIQYPEGLKMDSLYSQLQSLLAANKLSDKDAVIRVQVWRKGGRGYTIKAPGRAGYSITAVRYHQKKTAYKLATVDVKKIPSAAVPARFKLSNGINYILAAGQAAQKGADDALMETIDNFILETTIANIFWIKDDIVYTPSLDCDILPGITRAVCINLLQKRLNVKVNEGAFTQSDIKSAEIVWICNSLREIQPVQRIDETIFNTAHPFLESFIKAFETYRNQHLFKK